MHILAFDPLAFVVVVLCLAFVICVHLFAGRPILFLILTIGRATIGEYAARAGGLQGKGAKTKLANAETRDIGQASASSSFQSSEKAAIRSRLATNKVCFFSIANEIMDCGSID